MLFFFDSIIGVVVAVLLLVIVVVISAYRDIVRNSFSKRRQIVITIFLFCWYIATFVMVKLFPELHILTLNKTIYAIGSMCVLGVIVAICYVYE